MNRFIKRSEINPLPEYFDKYINKCDDVIVSQAIQTSINELDNLPIKAWETIGNKTYEPGKWTIKDILQHLIDTERIFTYRALAFARGDDQAIPSFPEDDYAVSANANSRTIEQLVNELRTTHNAFKSMYDSFSPEVQNRTGMGFKGKYSVASIGFLVPGHQRWHLDFIEEKYLNL